MEFIFVGYASELEVEQEEKKLEDILQYEISTDTLPSGNTPKEE